MRAILCVMLCSVCCTASAQTVFISGSSLGVSGRRPEAVPTVQDANRAVPVVKQELFVEQTPTDTERILEHLTAIRAALEERPPVAVTADGGKTAQNLIPTDRPDRFSFSAAAPDPSPDPSPVPSPVPLPAAPVLEVWSITGCQPCQRMQSAIDRGLLGNITVVKNRGPRPDPSKGYPQLRLGSQVWIGWGEHLIQTIRNQASNTVARTAPQKEETQQSLGVSPKFVNYPGWGSVNVDTFGVCDGCPMCRDILRRRAQRRAAGLAQNQSPHQENTPHDTLDRALAVLDLGVTDRLLDLGCGDATTLIRAVNQFGCQATGVEIDPAKVKEARLAVARAGLQGRVQILEGDALQFRPADHGITAAVVFLYPDLLKQLQPGLQQVPRVASPFHAVPGLSMEKHQDVWFRS